MDFANKGNGGDSSSSVPLTKKRGRPRKDKSENLSNVRNAADNSDDVKVGQAVNGIVEATFDAGYLLSVRIGNSDTSMRGFVFRPGHFAPVATHNDIAPHLQMVTTSTLGKGRGRGRGKARSGSRLMHSDDGLVTYSGRQLQVAPVQSSSLLCERGTIVPVVFEPPHLAASRGRLGNQGEMNQVEKDREIDNVKLPGFVMEELVNQVLKRIEGSTKEKESRKESGEGSGGYKYGLMQDLNEPFLVDHANQFNDFPEVTRDFGCARPGKMTELLLEKVVDKQAVEVQHNVSSRRQH